MDHFKLGFLLRDLSLVLEEWVMDGQAKSYHDFKSPVRVLAAFFQKSRDNWKQKCLEAKTELKRWKVRVADVGKSRDDWRSKAEIRQKEIEALQAQVQLQQDQLAEAASTIAADERKKR